MLNTLHGFVYKIPNGGEMPQWVSGLPLQAKGPEFKFHYPHTNAGDGCMSMYVSSGIGVQRQAGAWSLPVSEAS